MNEVVIKKNGLLKIKFNNESKCDNLVEVIIDSFKKNQTDAILIETCTNCPCSEPLTLGQFDIGKELADYFKTKSVQIGVYGNCSMFTHFTETVAQNRGLNMKVSNNKTDIINWFESY